MAESLEMYERVCVAWKTAIPFMYVSRTSPVFSLLDSEWYLQARLRTSDRGGCVISLHKASTEDRLQQVFTVTTYIEGPQTDSIPRMSVSSTVKGRKQDIWDADMDDISYYIQSFPNRSELKIVCLFDVSPTPTYKCRNESMLFSTQADSEFTDLSKSRLSSDKAVQACPDVFYDPENLSRDLNEFLKCGTSPDVRLRCGDRTVPAHKSILAARSGFFALRHSISEDDSEVQTVGVEDIDATVLGSFLKYLYSGEIQGLSESTVPSLYVASSKYAVSSLKNICSQWMIGNLSQENCMETLVFANANADEDLKALVVNFIAEHSQVLRSPAWSALHQKDPRLVNNVYQSCFERNVLNQMSPREG